MWYIFVISPSPSAPGFNPLHRRLMSQFPFMTPSIDATLKWCLSSKEIVTCNIQILICLSLIYLSGSGQALKTHALTVITVTIMEWKVVRIGNGHIWTINQHAKSWFLTRYMQDTERFVLCFCTSAERLLSVAYRRFALEVLCRCGNQWIAQNWEGE